MSDFNVENINLDLNDIDDLDDLLNDELPTQGIDQIDKKELSFFYNIPVEVTLEVASTKLVIGDLMQLGSGAVIELDKLVDEPLDVKVNGKMLATAELVVINGKYGIKIIDVTDNVMHGFNK